MFISLVCAAYIKHETPSDHHSLQLWIAVPMELCGLVESVIGEKESRKFGVLGNI